MKKTIILCLSLLPMLVFGQKVEITKPYKYTASNNDSRNAAKAKAMEEAQAALLQELGVLVEARQKMTTSTSGNSSNQDFSEELQTYTIGKVQTVVVAGTEKFSDDDKGNMVYSATFKMAVDTADLYRYLDNIVKQKEQARLAQIQKEQKIQRIKKEIEDLKKQVDIAKSKENEAAKNKTLAEKKLTQLKTQLNIAQQDYKNTLSAPNASEPAGMARTKNAMDYLTQTQNLYNAQEAEYRNLEKALVEAVNGINSAQDKLYNTETELAKKTGAPLPAKPSNAVVYSSSANNTTTTVNVSQNLPATKNINGIECVLVKAGTFMMGSQTNERGRYEDETRHQVTLQKGFWISKYEITQA